MGGIGQNKIIKTALTLIVIGAASLLFIRFLLPCLLPFILAFFTAWLIEPVVSHFTVRTGRGRGIFSAVCVLFLIFTLTGSLVLFVSKLIYEAVDLIQSLPEILAGIPEFIEDVKSAVRRFISRSPDGVREYISSAVACIYDKVSELPGVLSSKVLQWLSSVASHSPKIILFLATFSIGSFFISKSYPSILSFIKKQIPLQLHDKARNIKRDILSGIGKWMKAQILMMLVTFFELTVAFLILGFDHAGIIALITALIDALPVFGTGIILLPWAVILFINGNVNQAVGLLITYLIVTVVRSCLEPRLVGSQFGIDPAATLLAMYSGFKLTGIWGMILFPFVLMIIKQMNDKGYIRLWK